MRKIVCIIISFIFHKIIKFQNTNNYSYFRYFSDIQNSFNVYNEVNYLFSDLFHWSLYNMIIVIYARTLSLVITRWFLNAHVNFAFPYRLVCRDSQTKWKWNVYWPHYASRSGPQIHSALFYVVWCCRYDL